MKHFDPMGLSRRQVLSRATGAGLFFGLGGVAPGWAMQFARECDEDEAPSGASRAPTLVVIFLRGGADGLHFVVPHADDAYYELRGPLAVPRPGETGGAVDLGGGFGLHPSCAALAPLFESGVATAVHALGHPDNSRSHFVEQDRWELAHPGAELDTPGWLGRVLLARKPQGPIRAMALGDSVPLGLRGPVTALALPGLEGVGVPGEGATLDATVKALERAYGGRRRDALARGGRSTLEALERLAEVASDPFEPRGDYPDGTFGSRMREAARLVRSGLGIEIIEVDLNGFDTHRGQANAWNGLGNQLARGIAAFAKDVDERMDDVLVMTVSEFGRTARVNGTGGTDHGGGSASLLVGGAVRAKDGAPRGVLGDWPGLGKDALHQNRDLKITTDVRDVYAEVCERFLGIERTEAVLPGWTATPRGVLPKIG